MNTSEHTLRRALLPTAVIVLLWSTLIVVGALGSFIDQAKLGANPVFFRLVSQWFFDHVLLIVLACACHELFRRRPHLIASWRPVALMGVTVVVCFVPVQVLFQIATGAWLDKTPVLPGGLRVAWSKTNSLHFFFESFWAIFNCTLVVAVSIWRDARARQQAWMQSQNENVSLRLALEQQRIQALRGQLNPHFLFNALNAISALVRTQDSKMALAGIGHLSDLLRYALQASERNHVSLEDERRFVADYLALQKMRYGARLQVHIAGDDVAGLAGDVPPLLLQPLIENALRHDLDCHDGPSDIRLSFGGDAERLTISVSNPLSASRTTNPGLGLGLHHSRSRLQLAYGADATLNASAAQGRFVVAISMPRYALAA